MLVNIDKQPMASNNNWLRQNTAIPVSRDRRERNTALEFRVVSKETQFS